MPGKTPQTLCIRKHATGNALVEYLLPACLIIGVSFSVLVAIGAGMNFQFGSVKSDANSKLTNAQTQNANHQTQKNAFLPAAPYQTVNSNGVSGAAITSNLTNIIQTAGANGGTDALASTLDEYIKNLKDNSNLTPDQINQLSQLANAGHELARAEKALNDALNSGQGTVTYNGKSYTTADFQNQFGFSNPDWDTTDALNPINGPNPMLTNFMALYNQAKSNGSLNDPAVSTTVTFLSSEIAALGGAVQVNDTPGAQASAQMLYNGLQNYPVPTNIPGVTNVYSGGICGSGKGTDSGTSCP